jgi:uncharacterized damage-inducible protein DinB
MDVREHLQQLAAYHAWAGTRLFDGLRPLPEHDYRRDCGLFFRSVHGTLNHLLLADRIWYGRFVGEPVTVRGLDEELVAGRDELQRQSMQAAARWGGLLASLTAGRFDSDLVFVTTAGTARSAPFAATLAHVFNHGTHHRGQISPALTSMGQPAPELDLIFFIRERQQAAGGDPIAQADAFLQARFEALDDEIAHYPSPIARCDEQLTKLIEQRTEVLGHHRRLRQAASAGGTCVEVAHLAAQLLAAEAGDSAEGETLRRRLLALADGDGAVPGQTPQSGAVRPSS